MFSKVCLWAFANREIQGRGSVSAISKMLTFERDNGVTPTKAESSTCVSSSPGSTKGKKRVRFADEEDLGNQESPAKGNADHHFPGQQNTTTPTQPLRSIFQPKRRRVYSPSESSNESESIQFDDPIAQRFAEMSLEHGYPAFANADVLIQSPTGKAWKLHKSMLVRASPVFDKLFASKEPLKITKKQGAEGVTIKWKMIMVDNVNASATDPNGLCFKTFKFMVRFFSASILRVDFAFQIPIFRSLLYRSSTSALRISASQTYKRAPFNK